MSVTYPLWCIVCKKDGFVGTRFEKPGTAASYIKYCPSCGKEEVLHEKVETKTEHHKIIDGDITYKDLQ